MLGYERGASASQKVLNLVKGLNSNKFIDSSTGNKEKSKQNDISQTDDDPDLASELETDYDDKYNSVDTTSQEYLKLKHFIDSFINPSNQ
jgi:hypothetical protein